MYLKSIELSGFKSFAKKSVLEFNSPISAIVGPNGSGKSNVAEAFRFVLGEQSIKSMRGKKGEDLIFNGAGGEARANRASVKVIFDNTEKIFKQIDFPEVSIERVVHRDGVNEYFINGSTVRLRDILELLASAHIGSSGHHIISQGEADKILNSSPKERKGMIEDALGLKIYQYKRVESERKLAKTFENIAQVESLRKEIAPHLKFLRKQVEKIEKAESMKQELIALAKEYFKRESIFIALSKSALSEERKPLERRLEDLSAEFKKAKAVLEEGAKKEKKDYLILELEKEIAGARSLKDSLVRELGKVEGLITGEERVIKKQEELSASDEHKIIRLKDVEDLAREIEKDETLTLKAVVEKLFSFIKSKRESLDSGALKDAQASLTNLKIDKSRLEKELAEAEQKEKSLLERYEEMKKDLERQKDSSRDAERAVFRIMSEENEIIAKLNAIKLREDSLKKDDEEFKREMEEVAHVVGSEVLHFKDTEVGSETAVFAEDRKIQEERKRMLEKLKIRLEDTGIAGTDDVMKEFKDTTERDEFLARELLDLEKSAQSLNDLIKDLEKRLAMEFSAGLENINKKFKELFTTMFGGGEAELTLTKIKKPAVEAMLEGEDVEPSEDDEVIEEGLDISVNLPRKKIRSLMMLSGGERALTSIALIFAISQVNPPPFIILDETDAALDEANSKKYGDMVEKLANHSQLILITHNRETMSRAGVIYGVTMSSSGVSKLLSIEFEEAVQVAK